MCLVKKLNNLILYFDDQVFGENTFIDAHIEQVL